MYTRRAAGAFASTPAFRRAGAMFATLTLCGMVAQFAVSAGAGEAQQARTARGCLDVALAAADAWAEDARLVWVENDAPVDEAGRAAAWGFLFYSPARGTMRSYSVQGEALRLAEDHAVTAPAPGLAEWLDSSAVVRKAWDRAREHAPAGCTLESLLLVRGVFAPEAAWVAVFARGDSPRLYVVCDARSGDVLRDWRG